MGGIQLDSLIQYLQKAFPIYPDETTADARLAVEQFGIKNNRVQVLSDPVQEWSQGDILNTIPFLDFTEDGKLSNIKAPGMIITSTCDLDRKETIVLCPCFPLEKFKPLKAYTEISKNNVFEFFFIGNGLTGGEWVVDISRPMTLLRSRLLKRIKDGDITRLHSLTRVGWYLFITKFSMKYFRPDDSSTLYERQHL
ncbi:MAG: hypothetical protein KME38_28990 [Spirirestis rafaelensis WJT71-NPBG6]|jgi:hypothetical protein|nr:hypothetical protein [Spirirestis rafaelensis WJT71-NPBG6]